MHHLWGEPGSAATPDNKQNQKGSVSFQMSKISNYV
jgi:hypothetical protein